MSARSEKTTQGFTTPHFIQNQILKYMYNICKDKVQFRLKFTLSCGTSVHRVYTLQLSFLRKAFMSPAACCLPLSLPWRLCLPPPSCSSSSSSLATSTLATTGWCHSALLCIGIWAVLLWMLLEIARCFANAMFSSMLMGSTISRIK